MRIHCRTVLNAVIALVLVLGITTSCWAGTIMGKVVPAVEGGQVVLVEKDKGWGDPVWTDKNGQFRFNNVAAGVYTIHVDCGGYVVTEAENEIHLAENAVSKDNIINLVRGGILKGKVAPANLTVRIELLNPQGEKCYETEGNSGTYEVTDKIEAGKYTVKASIIIGKDEHDGHYSLMPSKKYMPANFSIEIADGETVVHNINFQKTGSISGKISSAKGHKGGIGAKNADNGRIATWGDIRADGSYKIDGLEPGNYELIILAKGCERVFGCGRGPKVDTLTAKEKRDVKALIAAYYKAWDSKDIDGLVRLWPKQSQKDIEQDRRDYAEELDGWKRCSSQYRVDYVGGASKKSAVAICKTYQKFVWKTTDDKSPAVMNHEVFSLVYEAGSWKVKTIENCFSDDHTEGFEQDVPANIHTDCALVFVMPMEGEPGYISPESAARSHRKYIPKVMPWRYSADPRIVGIKVESGKESKGHNFTLTPLPKK